MSILQGIPVSPGVVIGEALVIGTEGFRIPHRFVARSAVEEELGRLRQAFKAVESEIDENRRNIAQELGEQYGAIFAAHLQPDSSAPKAGITRSAPTKSSSKRSGYPARATRSCVASS